MYLPQTSIRSTFSVPIIFMSLVCSLSCGENQPEERSVNQESIIQENTIPLDTNRPEVQTIGEVPQAQQEVTLAQKKLSIKRDGRSLIEANDCRSCHNMDTKLTGPSYIEIANAYSISDIDYLSQKIIDGGMGVWGDIPMSPHEGLSKEDAKEMVKYILAIE